MRAIRLLVMGAALACSNRERCEGSSRLATEHATAGRTAAARALRDEVWTACQDKVVIARLDAAIVAAESRPASPPSKPEPTLAELLDSKRQVRSALALVSNRFGDSSGDVDPGAALFAVWAAKYLRWSDLNSLMETKRALVMKDVASERAKRLCTSGTISEIKIDRSVAPPVFSGGIVNNGGDVARFVAVGSTGDVVENSFARFCGVVTGVMAFKNLYGNEVQSVFLVGMFDIPQTRPSPPVSKVERRTDAELEVRPGSKAPSTTDPPVWLQNEQSVQEPPVTP